MIVQCEICQTKYNIENSKITPQGVRVRCSKCKHIFSVKPSSPSPPPPPPPPSPPSPLTPEAAGDDFLQDLESFERFHKELMETPGIETEPPKDEEGLFEREEFDQIFQEMPQVTPSGAPSAAELPTEEWPSAFHEEPKQTEFMEGDMETPTFDMKGLEGKGYFKEPRATPKERKTSWSFVLIGILIIVALGGYYLWSEKKVKFSIPWDIPSFLQPISDKVQSLVDNIRGIERGSLSFSDLEGYKDTIGKIPVFVITGKVLNDTNKTKKHVRIKAILLNDKNKVLEEKQTMCGSYFTKEELRTLPPRFARNNFSIRPKPTQIRVAPRTSIPFTVIFPNMPPDANEFQVEIVEAPNA